MFPNLTHSGGSSNFGKISKHHSYYQSLLVLAIAWLHVLISQNHNYDMIRIAMGILAHVFCQFSLFKLSLTLLSLIVLIELIWTEIIMRHHYDIQRNGRAMLDGTN